MKKKRVHELFPLVAKKTGLPEYMVQGVISAHFDELKRLINEPTHAAIHFDFFGKLITTPKQVALRVRDAISSYRREPSEKRKEKISQLWALYRNAQAYNNAVNYKTRFGSWHWRNEQQVNEQSEQV